MLLVLELVLVGMVLKDLILAADCSVVILQVGKMKIPKTERKYLFSTRSFLDCRKNDMASSKALETDSIDSVSLIKPVSLSRALYKASRSLSSADVRRDDRS